MGGDVANTLSGLGGSGRDDLVQQSLCLVRQRLGSSKGDRDSWFLLLVIIVSCLPISVCMSVAVCGADVSLRDVNSNTGLIADLFKRRAYSNNVILLHEG